MFLIALEMFVLFVMVDVGSRCFKVLWQLFMSSFLWLQTSSTLSCCTLITSQTQDKISLLLRCECEAAGLAARATTVAAEQSRGSAVIMTSEVETYSSLTHSSLSPVNAAVGAHQAWGRISCGLTSVLWRHPPLRQIPGHSHRRTLAHTHTY